jgi:phthiocerol/phenolphthiocerol synthesis type-I polyketide synthase A
VAWDGLGFASDAQIAVQELERIGSRPVTPDEAFPAWEELSCYEVAQAVMAPMPSSDAPASAASDEDRILRAKRSWSQMAAEDVLIELEIGLRSILAGELGMPELELELDRPFADMGLDSVMAMAVRRKTEQLVGIELSATMLWNHPTIVLLAEHLAKKLVPQKDSESGIDVVLDSAGSVLDALFDSVESAPAGSESRI